ncbi:hypothetical protein SGO26_22220 [Cupriavidus metallidurans]|uniref:chemotaxis protein CheY n=1 Tax=Cupriavidus TaxID=106589 RepID=UPI00055ABD93|nr:MULTISPECIES: chemotaxis protein CheY [Cupriavidus]GMG93602.1 hypothetical protein Cmtc_48220 [Cupriavidus sp. TKC]HBD38873.1 hypothetical protein [Cupriavidus sp.]HBO77527.1 hypothetical protein [Cupriavidus sp.]
MISRTDTDRLTVYLVERTPAVRRRQLRLLASLDGLRVAGAGHDAQAHQTELVDLQPDVVLIGLNATENTPLPRIRALAIALPASTLIVLANEGTPQMRRACLMAGVAHCFDKTLEIVELRNLLLAMASAARQHRKVTA